MQIEYEMEISAQEMFDYVCDQTVEDYYISTEKDITKEALHKDFKYKRRVTQVEAFGKKSKNEGVTVIIKEFKDPTLIQINMSAASTKTILRYEITQDPQEEFFCKVKYTEEIYKKGKKEEEQKRGAFWVFKKNPEKDMLQRMKKVEKYINKNRERNMEALDRELEAARKSKEEQKAEAE